jgi:hypothetical protein
MAVTMKSAVLWYMTTLCGSWQNRPIASIFRKKRLSVPLVYNEDIPHGGRGREPLATLFPG